MDSAAISMARDVKDRSDSSTHYFIPGVVHRKLNVSVGQLAFLQLDSFFPPEISLDNVARRVPIGQPLSDCTSSCLPAGSFLT